MANITIGPGGGIVADGVVTYLPSCSVMSYSDVSWGAAEDYDITSTEYLEVGAQWVALACTVGGRWSVSLRLCCPSTTAGSSCGLQVPCMRHRPACPALLASRAAQKLVPTIVPGIILGVLCLLGFTFFSLWS